MMKLRALVVESNPEDLLFLDNALSEIGEGRHWTQWVQVETHHAASWQEAAAILSSRPISVVLLNLNLSDSHGAETFRRTRELAPQIPIVLTVDAPDRELAAQLIRDGAQDFLLKGQIDCGPLIHSLENAIERHRTVSALRATTMIDPLTGLLNRGGFLSLAGRDRMLAERLGARFILISAESANARGRADRPSRSNPSQDLALVEAADHLRSLAGPIGLTARIGENRFAMTLFDSPAERVEAAWARVESPSNSSIALALGFSIYDSRNPVALEVLLDQAEADLRARAAVRTTPLPTSIAPPNPLPGKAASARS